MSITSLPIPPTREDPVNFADRADAFVGALPTFVSEMNSEIENINTKAAQVNSNASLAAEAAAEVTSLVAANLWTPGATYGSGEAAISPITYQTYRRKAPGGVDSTDPSASSLWVAVLGDKLERSGDTATDLTVSEHLYIEGETVVDGAISETFYEIPTTSPVIDPRNGSYQVISLDRNVSFSLNFPTVLNRGETVTIQIQPLTYNITWPSNIAWIGGAAPTILQDASGNRYSFVTLWRKAGNIFGSFGGTAWV